MVAWRRVLPALLGVLVLAAAASWVVATQLSAAPDQRLVDLDVYRNAGRSVLDGRGLYDYLSHAPQHLRFTYPPFAAILAVPLAWVPFAAATWLWTVVEIGCTTAITWFGFRSWFARLGRWWPLALGVLAGAMQQMLPFRDELKFGQVDELLVLACVVDCMLLSRRRFGGVLVGLATAVKLTPGVFLVYLVVTGRRRAAALAAATFVAVTLLSAAVLPGESQTFWTDAVFHSERLRSNANTSNQSLRGMWLRAVHDPHLVTALWLASVAVVALAGFARARRAALAGAELTGVALTGLLAVLLSPVAWIHHLVWLPLVLGALVGSARDRGRWLVAAFVCAFFVVKVPWIGAHWVHSGGPNVVARIVEDGFGLMALVLLMTLRTHNVEQTADTLARTVTLRHNEAIQPGGPS